MLDLELLHQDLRLQLQELLRQGVHPQLSLQIIIQQDLIILAQEVLAQEVLLLDRVEAVLHQVPLAPPDELADKSMLISFI